MSIYKEDGKTLKSSDFKYDINNVNDIKVILSESCDIISSTHSSGLHKRHMNVEAYRAYYALLEEYNKGQDADHLKMNRLHTELEEAKKLKYTNLYKLSNTKNPFIEFYINGSRFAGKLLQDIYFKYIFEVTDQKTKTNEATLKLVQVSMPDPESVEFLLQDKQNNNLAGWLETAMEQVFKAESECGLNNWLKILLKTEPRNESFITSYMKLYFDETLVNVKILTDEHKNSSIFKHPLQDIADELYDGRIDVAIQMDKLKNKKPTNETSLFGKRKTKGLSGT